MKPQFPANRLTSKQTKPGTQPNDSPNPSVCVKHLTTGEVKRVKKSAAEKLVAAGEWRYAKKSEYK